MKSPPRYLPLFPVICCWLSLSWPAPVLADTGPREDGPVGVVQPPESDAERWQEQAYSLPAYPQQQRLLEIAVDIPGFHAYVDPDSLSAGKDKVVRFTSVLVSGSGVWNVTYEGLHCGEERYRRFAYGADGQWHGVTGSDWQPLTGTGSGRYRKLLYMQYMCNPVEPYRGAEVILRRLQASRPMAGE
jgi:hypothetical protein